MDRVLVVDDDPAMRRLLRAILRDRYAIEEAEHGQDALRQLRKQPFGLVITDLVMPDMEGIELLREIRRVYPSIKTVAISGALRNSTYLSVAGRIGAHATLPKPFDPNVLLALLQNLETLD